MFLKTQGLDHDLYVCLDNGILKKTNGEKRMTVNKKKCLLPIVQHMLFVGVLVKCEMKRETERNEIYQNETKQNETTPCLSLPYTEGFPKWANRGANDCTN